MNWRGLIIGLGLFVSSSAWGGNFGFVMGTGLPFTSQFGLSYLTGSKSLSFDLMYNSFKLTSGLANVSMTKPELMAKWHPFAGSFYLGVGVGQFTLSADATDALTSLTAKVTVTSLAVTPTMGWAWGISNGGFFMGLDFGYQSPSGAKTEIESLLPTTDQAYIDAVEQGNKLGETALPVFSFLKFGYLF